MADGLTNVEMAPSGNAYCGFCDTAIEERTPRVVRSYFNGPSARWQEDYLHAACAFHYNDSSWSSPVASTCVGCTLPLDKNDHVISIFSGPPPCPRFMPSESCGALHYCYACCGTFVSQHRSLLNGYLGADQQAAPVAWRNDGTPFELLRWCGKPPLPKNGEQRRAFLDLFRANSNESEALALRRHEELRARIAEADRRGIRRQDGRQKAARRSPTVATAECLRSLATASPILQQQWKRRRTGGLA